MKKQLHSRPNLEHLRREAKALLASLPKSEAAAKTFIDHHPAARQLSLPQVRAANFRLADAQFAVARKEGFSSWPKLAIHVAQLRAMEGTWDFVALEMDGAPLSSISFRDSHLLIDGDRFCMRSPEANYEGIFIIDVEAQPHAIDIHFVEGPEAGKSSVGLFELDGENLRICLGLTGIARPAAFATSAGSGHALERLVRSSHQRPADLSAGQPPSKTIGAIASDAPQGALDAEGFEFSAAPVFDRLAGNWLAIEAVRDGQALPASMLAAGKRVGSRNETKVSFGGRVMIDARMRIDITCTPMEIDYLHTSGAAKGKVQHGIMAWVNDDVRFCMAAPGDLRPTDFSCGSGSGRTLSTWRRA